MSVPSNGMPSSTQSGSCVPLMEDVPRMRNFTGAPGEPEEVTLDSPAICPAKAWSMLLTPPIISSDIFIVVTAEVSLRRSMA